MTTSAFDHIEEAWGLNGNPFPHSGISAGKEPYSPEVFPEETEAFHNEIIRGGIQGRRQIGFLWSKGPGGDTGYGKTALMRATVDDINADWGMDIEAATGMKQDRSPRRGGLLRTRHPPRTGLYPVLFNAVIGMATGANPPLRKAHDLICENLGDDDAEEIANSLTQTRLAIVPTSSALRPDLIDVFARSPTSWPSSSARSLTTNPQLVQYLTFALIVFAAAGARKLFLMIDQLEDLATNKALSAAKRRREIGRIRDLMETEPYASMLHMTYTFHATAARNWSRSGSRTDSRASKMRRATNRQS